MMFILLLFSSKYSAQLLPICRLVVVAAAAQPATRKSRKFVLPSFHLRTLLRVYNIVFWSTQQVA
uniref:Secreted protein n=1 Tax=Lutzomyia longipalpis TaxID=7200 RepID=A0A1B0GJU7_LUTLO